MTDSRPFLPKWASPPGRTILDCLAERRVSVEEFGKRIGEPRASVGALLAGETSISISLARRLAEVLGASIEFWMARDGQYWDDRQRVEADVWIRTLPVAQMEKLNWLGQQSKAESRVARCLDFFGVADVAEWLSTYSPMLAGTQFRMSSIGTPVPAAVAAWLRQAERRTERSHVKSWNQDSFSVSIEWARRWIREKDPRVFVPALVEEFAVSGVALVVLQAPPGCPVSGAAWITPDGVPSIVLSARYLVDDHFWFTLMHEAGHLLLHGPDRTFVESLDSADQVAAGNGKAEDEANAFASEVLVPSHLIAEMTKPTTARDVVRFSLAAGVSPGVAVGQLQHRGIVGYEQFNHLKRRYRWDGDVLAAK